jgi:predicted ribosome quality control (RQC) complex YloA/Tae2 family protein
MNIQKPTVLDAARISSELNRYRGAVISQIWRNDNSTLIELELKNPEAYLRYTVENKYACLALIDSISANLRQIGKGVWGSQIVGANQLGGDRIISLELEREDRLGRVHPSRLIFELIPNHGNAILTSDDFTIKWSLRKQEGEYKLPQKLRKPTVFNFNEHRAVLQIEKPSDIAELIYGLSDRDMVNLNLESQTSIEDYFLAINTYVTRAIQPGQAWIIYQDENPMGYSLVSPTLLPGENQRQYDSALSMYNSYYHDATSKKSEEDRLETLLRLLDKEIDRQANKLGSLENEKLKAEESRRYKVYGELVLANIDSIKKGINKVHLRNFEGQIPEYIEINLDPSKSPSANANDLFKRYKKAASTLNSLAGRLKSTQEKHLQLISLKRRFADDPEALSHELELIGIIPKSAGPRIRKTVARRLPYKKYISTSGWEIWVGRTNTDNDELTFKIAAKEDYWFHAWQAAGSHTVLRLPTRQSVPDKKTLLEAAALAAYFSKARTSSKVPVAYTQVKFVRKPRNFPPGKVLVEKEKQLIVKPLEPEHFLATGEYDE